MGFVKERLDTLLDMHFEKNGRPKGHLAPPEKSILKHRFQSQFFIFHRIVRNIELHKYIVVELYNYCIKLLLND